MDFDAIFAAMYTAYRGEADVPDSDDDEYTIALRYANDALNRWSQFDGTYWNSLFTTAQTNSTGGTVTISTGVTSYACPTAMKEAGGYVRLIDGNGTVQQRIPIIEAEQAQFRSDLSKYCYFTGDPTNGFTLHLNGAPTSDMNGWLIDYIYYKKPTQYATGASKSECPDPYFIVNDMLANRFRVSRNYSSYQIAKRDAEEALKNMQRDNNSGTWANPWKLPDNSGAVWGESTSNGWDW